MRNNTPSTIKRLGIASAVLAALTIWHVLSRGLVVLVASNSGVEQPYWSVSAPLGSGSYLILCAARSYC